MASGLNFQNILSIDKVFSTLVGKPFFKQIKQFKWRLAEKPGDEFEVCHDDLNKLQEFFDLRHQLIHNPNADLMQTSEIVMDKISSILNVIMASDLVLIQFIDENIDPEISFKNNSG